MKASELTLLASNWLAAQYPQSIIVTEFSVASWGGASIDIAAITDTEIIGVEVKGEGDSPARLPLQGHVYSRVASRMWLLPDVSIEARCVKSKPIGWGQLEVFGGTVRAYNKHYVFGEKIKSGSGYTYPMVRDESEYTPSTADYLDPKCPWAMCGTLWRDELFDLAGRCGIGIKRAAREGEIIAAITSKLPAPKIHAETIVSLNLRKWRKPVLDLRTSAPAVAQGRLI